MSCAGAHSSVPVVDESGQDRLLVWAVARAEQVGDVFALARGSEGEGCCRGVGLVAVEGAYGDGERNPGAANVGLEGEIQAQRPLPSRCFPARVPRT